jgi:hypothetical protein
MNVKVYQMKSGDDYRFRRFRELPDEVNDVDLSDYDLVWDGELAAQPENDDIRALDYLFHELNVGDKPLGYQGYSLSVGDLVALEGRLYCCQSIGWKQVAVTNRDLLKVGQTFDIQGVVTTVFDLFERSSAYGYNGKMAVLEIDDREWPGTFWWRTHEQRQGDPGKLLIRMPVLALVELVLENGYQVAAS